MTNPMPAEASLEQFYQQDYRRYYRRGNNPSIGLIGKYRLDQRADYTASFLEAEGLLTSGARVLDVGCAEGSLLRAVRDRMPHTTRMGIEPNPGYAAFSKDWAGADVYSDLAVVESRNDAFDLIIANHVLEHMREPAAFLARLRKLVQGSGAVYIDVPDPTRYSSIAALHLAHLYHFTPTALSRLAGVAGFSVVKGMHHEPPAHPPSFRVLLAPGPARPPHVAPDADANVVRDRIRRIRRLAPIYFVRRSLLGRALLDAPGAWWRSLTA
jgi:SAM-dependent methyltransferase